MSKKKVYEKNSLVRELARERIGPPKPKQVIMSKKDKPPRHKARIEDE